MGWKLYIKGNHFMRDSRKNEKGWKILKKQFRSFLSGNMVGSYSSNSYDEVDKSTVVVLRMYEY